MNDKKRIKENIASYIENNKKWLQENLLELISIDTTNTPPYGNEDNGQKFIKLLLKNLGMTIDMFLPYEVISFKESDIYLKGRIYENRNNLVGKIGAGSKATLIFNGHIDTVNSTDLKWNIVEPFKPKMIDGKIYGLGSSDMKGGLAAAIFALKTIVDLNISIKGKVILESVVDEEFGGGNGTLACVKKGYEGDFAVIMEPTALNICVSNVSSMAMDVEIIGDFGMDYLESKNNKIKNPIFIAAQLIYALKKLESHLNCYKEKYEVYKQIDNPMRFLFSDIGAGKVDPCSPLRMPSRCLIRVYLMNYPDIFKEDFISTIYKFLKKFPDLNSGLKDGLITLKPASTAGGQQRFIEGGNFDLNKEINKRFVDSIIQNAMDFCGKKLNISAMLGGTDFFAFSNYSSTPVVVLGPGGGNCHGPDEYVNFKDLIDLSKIYAGIIYDYCC